jgi:hypothetical protein
MKIKEIKKEKKKIKEIKKENTERKKEKASKEQKIKALISNLQTNIIFYVIVICNLYYLSRNKEFNGNKFQLYFTFIVISILGYQIHYISHNIYFAEFYRDSNPILKDNIITNYLLTLFCDIVDYHRVYHHDMQINKTWKHLVGEFLSNILMQGLYPALIFKLFSYLDLRIVMIWGLFYATFHIINYSYVKPKSHIDHHFHEYTNYGIDIYDIIFGSKYDWENTENYNHFSINITLICLCVGMAYKHGFIK